MVINGYYWLLMVINGYYGINNGYWLFLVTMIANGSSPWHWWSSGAPLPSPVVM